METTVKGFLEQFLESKMRIQFRPDGNISYRYGDTEKSFSHYIESSDWFVNRLLIRIKESELDGEGKIVREYEKGLKSIPERIQNRNIKKVERIDIDITTSSTGKTVTHKMIIDIEIY